MEELPVAITPHIRISENNQPINLYTGEIKVSKIESDETFQANVNIQLSWLPYPRIEFEISVPSSFSILLPLEDNISLTLNEGTIITGRLTTINTQLGISKETERLNSKLFGIITNDPVILPKENQIEVRRVKFLVPNFSNLLGLPVNYLDSDQTEISRGRLILRGGGWVITLDPVDQLKEIEKTLKQSSGFAITHVGQLEKDDSSPFDSTDALGILEALTF